MITIRDEDIPAASLAPDVVQTYLDSPAFTGLIEELESHNITFAAAYGNRITVAQDLRTLAGMPQLSNRVRGEDPTLPTVAAACGTLATEVSSSVQESTEGRILFTDASRNVALLIQRMRSMQSAREGYSRPAGTAVLATSNEGRRMSEFRTNVLNIVNHLDRSHYWRTTGIPGSGDGAGTVRAALQPVRDACNAYISSLDNATIIRGTRAQADALEAAIGTLMTQIEGAAPPPENIEIRTDAPGYRIRRWLRAAVAGVLCATPTTEVIVKDFRPTEYLTRNIVGGETFMNPYRNYNMQELEKKWVETAGVNKEHLDGGTADTTKLSRLERVAADLILNKGDINKIGNPNFRKAVEEKVRTIKTESGEEIKDQGDKDKGGKAEKQQDPVLKSQEKEIASGYKIQRVGNEMILSVMDKDADSSQVGLHVALPGGKNYVKTELSGENGSFKAELPAEFANVERFFIIFDYIERSTATKHEVKHVEIISKK
jgi:hypothetical protein